MIRSKYNIVDDETTAQCLVIADVGHQTMLSVTNDIENVVADLVQRGLLPPGRRLAYYDSDGQLDEVIVSDGQFVDFRPLRRMGS